MPAPAPRASDAAPALAGTAVGTQRPEPGLARGVWEAPRWTFFAALAVIVVIAALYAVHRAGIVKDWRTARAHERQKRSAR